VAAKKKAASGGNSRFLTILAAVAVVGGGGITYVVMNSGPKAVELDPSAPPPKPQGYVMGSPEAPVEIIEFADFECPGCGHFATVTEPDIRERLVATGLARFRFVDLPLTSIHPNTLVAHNAAACANDQGKFWELHDRIFYGQTEWSTQATGNPTKVIKGYAKEIGLDQGAFDDCLDTRRHQRQIDANRLEAERLRVQGTPTFIIGNRMVYAGMSYDVIKAYVDSAAADVAAGTAQRRFGADTTAQ
jgi:protein-disulfide isomerase